ncbi:odorant-binding protein-like [Thomomys bottae]
MVPIPRADSIAMGKKDVKASAQSGAWRTYVLASNNSELIKEGGILRVFYRSMSCEGLCDEISNRFYVKQEEECLEYTVVAERINKSIYKGVFEGDNYFYSIRNTGDFLVYKKFNQDEDGNVTKVILVVGKPGSIPTEEQKEELQRILKENHLSRDNVQYVLEAGESPPSFLPTAYWEDPG